MILGPDRQPLKTADGSFLRVDVAEALSSAVPGCTPMAIPAPDVLAVDFDEPDNPQQVRRFEVLKDELAAAGYVPVITASGRPGHRHLWCLIEDAADNKRLTDLAKEGLKLSVRRGRPIRLPLAPHSEGLPVSLISPETPEGALRAVRRTVPTPPYIPVQRQPTGLHVVRPTSVPTTALGSKPAKALRHGADAAGYATRHGADMGIALSAVQAGWTFEHLHAAYDSPTNAGASKYRQLGPVKGLDYLRQTWQSAQRRAQNAPPRIDPEGAAELLATWQQQALARPWPARSGATDLALYLAFVQAGLTAPRATLTPAFSRTEMADAIGVWHSAVEKALRRLMDAGAVKEHEKGDRDHRTRWRVLPPPVTGERGVLVSQRENREEHPSLALQVDPAHDLFAGRALGLNAWQVLSVLGPDEPATAASLAAHTGRDVKTVRGYLRQFDDLHLAVPFGDGYVRVPQPNLDAAAAALGVVGASAARAAASAAKRANVVALRGKRENAAAKVVRADPTTGEVLNSWSTPTGTRPAGPTRS
jgi:predicted transcriptional regulator